MMLCGVAFHDDRERSLRPVDVEKNQHCCGLSTLMNRAGCLRYSSQALK